MDPDACLQTAGQAQHHAEPPGWQGARRFDAVRSHDLLGTRHCLLDVHLQRSAAGVWAIR